MNLHEAAQALGAHYQTAYAWVRQGVLPARKVGRGYEISAADARELADRRRQGTEPSRPIHVRDWAAQSRRLYQALTEGDETLARQRLGRLSGGVPLIDLCAYVIGPALVRIGDDWSAGPSTCCRGPARTPARASCCGTGAPRWPGSPRPFVMHGKRTGWARSPGTRRSFAPAGDG